MVETLALILTFSPGEKEQPLPAFGFADDQSRSVWSFSTEGAKVSERGERNRTSRSARFGLLKNGSRIESGEAEQLRAE
jgi:hypothetical protein